MILPSFLFLVIYIVWCIVSRISTFSGRWCMPINQPYEFSSLYLIALPPPSKFYNQWEYYRSVQSIIVHINWLIVCHHVPFPIYIYIYYTLLFKSYFIVITSVRIIILNVVCVLPIGNLHYPSDYINIIISQYVYHAASSGI